MWCYLNQTPHSLDEALKLIFQCPIIKVLILFHCKVRSFLKSIIWQVLLFNLHFLIVTHFNFLNLFFHRTLRWILFVFHNDLVLQRTQSLEYASNQSQFLAVGIDLYSFVSCLSCETFNCPIKNSLSAQDFKLIKSFNDLNDSNLRILPNAHNHFNDLNLALYILVKGAENYFISFNETFEMLETLLCSH